MTKLGLAALVGATVGGMGGGIAVGQVTIGATTTTTRSIFLQIPSGAGYFLTRPPRVGEPVEIIYVGKDRDGMLNFQLRVRQ